MSTDPVQLPITGQPKASSLMPFGTSGVQLSTVEHALVFAKAVLASGIAPRDCKTPESIFIRVQFGAEIGLTPMMSLQAIADINGKPALYGDAGKALLRANGFDIEETCDGTTARCTITKAGQKPVTRTFSVDEAKKAGLWNKQGPWSQYPSRMLSWRAFWFAARDAASHVLKGIGGAEELRDVTADEPRNVTPQNLAHTLEAIDAPKPVAEEPKPTEAPKEPAADLFQGDEQTREDIAASKARDQT